MPIVTPRAAICCFGRPRNSKRPFLQGPRRPSLSTRFAPNTLQDSLVGQEALRAPTPPPHPHATRSPPPNPVTLNPNQGSVRSGAPLSHKPPSPPSKKCSIRRPPRATKQCQRVELNRSGAPPDSQATCPLPKPEPRTLRKDVFDQVPPSLTSHRTRPENVFDQAPPALYEANVRV